MKSGGKITVVLFAGFAATTTSAAKAELAAPEFAQVCVDRPGEEGRVNITPTTVRMEGAGELTLLGEEKGCISAIPEAFKSISLKFYYPYGGVNEKARWWETTPTPIHLKSGETTRLTLCVREQNRNTDEWEKTGWHNMWLLVPPDRIKTCAPA